MSDQGDSKPKDLTSIFELEPAGESTEPVQSSAAQVAGEPPAETFESLEEYSQAHASELPAPIVEGAPVEDLADDLGAAVTGQMPDASLAKFEFSPNDASSEASAETAEIAETDVNATSDVSAESAPQAEPHDSLRNFAENAAIGRPSVPAALPYQVWITGVLNTHEKARLLDLVARENMGIREIDLEPQLEAGRVLIPEVSEYAGVLIVQALRGASADIRLVPSDASDRLVVAESSAIEAGRASAHVRRLGGNAGDLPVTTSHEIAGGGEHTVIDTLVASAPVGADGVFVSADSSEYAQTIDDLKVELVRKARLRGADAIVAFAATLTPGGGAYHRSRALVTGVAVKLSGARPPQEPSAASSPDPAL